MMKRYWNFIVLGVALAVSVSAASMNGQRADWTGLWELVQKTQSGPVTLRLHVPAEGSPILYGSSWEELVLAETSFESGGVSFNWQTQGVNLVFRGQRQGTRVEGTWELIHPQFSQTNSFSGKRLLTNATWKPLQGLQETDGGLFLDLNAPLLEHQADLAAYWNQTFYPDYLPLLGNAPPVERISAALDAPGLAGKSREFAGLVEDLAKRLELKYPAAPLPYRLAATPFGGASPEPVYVGQRSYLVMNAARMLDANRPDPGVKIPLALLRASFERLYFTAQFPAMESYRTGLPLYLYSELYPEHAREVIGLSEERLQALEENIGETKRRALAGEKLDPEENQHLAQHFARYLAQSQSPKSLLRLPPSAVNQHYKKFLKPE